MRRQTWRHLLKPHPHFLFFCFGWRCLLRCIWIYGKIMHTFKTNSHKKICELKLHAQSLWLHWTQKQLTPSFYYSMDCYACRRVIMATWSEKVGPLRFLFMHPQLVRQFSYTRQNYLICQRLSKRITFKFYWSILSNHFVYYLFYPKIFNNIFCFTYSVNKLSEN